MRKQVTSGLSQRKRYLSRIANAAESIHIRAPELTLLAVTGSLRQSTSASLVSAPPDRDWLDVGSAAVVEVTSEDGAHPVESALLQGEKRGWRAAGPGPQTIRLVFDKPQKLRRIWLKFEETEIKRTQEFVLRWPPDGGRSFLAIWPQQSNLRPPPPVRWPQS